MNSGGGLITAVNQRFADEGFRDRVRTMHASQTPLLEMVETLGLGGEMSDAVRQIVEDLSPDVVEGIRQATLEMLDAATRVMPVDCNLSQTEIDRGAAVDVSVVDEENQRTILVRAR
jgi:hypothetical protein